MLASPLKFQSRHGYGMWGGGARISAKWSRTKTGMIIERLKLPELSMLLNFSEIEYKNFFTGTALRRLGYSRFMRNVLIAVANSNDLSLLNGVKKKLNDHNELIQSMAVWALFCLDKKEFLYEKERNLKKTNSVLVIQEWNNREN